MKQIRLLLVVTFVLSLAIMIPTLASAEWYGGLYLGAAFPQDEDVKINSSAGGVTSSGSEGVDFKTSFTTGGRFGYWFKQDPWIGFALDASYFKIQDSVTDINTLPLSILVMFRYPGKQVQPYLGVGVGIFFTDIDQKVDLSSFGAGTQTAKDKALDTGLDVRGGVSVPFKERFSIFGEYRFTYFQPDYDDRVNGVKVKISTRSYTHSYLVGVSYHF